MIKGNSKVFLRLMGVGKTKNIKILKNFSYSKFDLNRSPNTPKKETF